MAMLATFIGGERDGLRRGAYDGARKPHDIGSKQAKPGQRASASPIRRVCACTRMNTETFRFVSRPPGRLEEHMTDDEIQAAIDQLKTQQAEQTAAIRCALEGRWAGEADSVAGHVKALDPELEVKSRSPRYD